jgi:hypothetical protein
MNCVMQRIAVCGVSLLTASAGFISLPLIAGAQVPAARTESTASLNPSTSAGNDPVQPIQPAESTPDITLDPATLIPELPPLPAAKATVIGGVVAKLDRVQDELTIQVFGGGRVSTLFDPRTRVYRNGEPASFEDLRKGERIYADTILLDGKVFARNIRMTGANSVGQSQGVVVAYHHDTGALTLRDALSPVPLQLRLTSATRIIRGNHLASTQDLSAGTLVAVDFQNDAGHAIARQVAILITPGTEFTFTGRITTLDLHLGLLVVASDIDHKSYDIYFDPSVIPTDDSLREGANVTVLTQYKDSRYVARGVTVNSNSPK